jgi:CBS domain containing-hemolysin-like protein
VWLFVSLVLGFLVTTIVTVLFRAIFHKRRGWVVDSVLLGFSGLLMVSAMMALFIYGEGVPKDLQKLLGYTLMLAIALPLVWASRRILRWREFSGSLTSRAKKPGVDEASR